MHKKIQFMVLSVWNHTLLAPSNFVVPTKFCAKHIQRIFFYQYYTSTSCTSLTAPIWKHRNGKTRNQKSLKPKFSYHQHELREKSTRNAMGGGHHDMPTARTRLHPLPKLSSIQVSLQLWGRRKGQRALCHPPKDVAITDSSQTTHGVSQIELKMNVLVHAGRSSNRNSSRANLSAPHSHVPSTKSFHEL